MKRIFSIAFIISLLLLGGCANNTVVKEKDDPDLKILKLENELKQLKMENSKLKIENAKLQKEVQYNSKEISGS